MAERTEAFNGECLDGLAFLKTGLRVSFLIIFNAPMLSGNWAFRAELKPNRLKVNKIRSQKRYIFVECSSHYMHIYLWDKVLNGLITFCWEF